MPIKTDTGPGAIRAQARQLLDAVAALDYRAITAHQPVAVAQLQQALRLLGLVEADPPPAAATRSAVNAAAAGGSLPQDSRGALQAVQGQLLEALRHAGFGDRIGRVYDSGTVHKLVAFKDVPHRRGLPTFALVVAPDYTPKAGVYAVFMNAQEVWSAFLPHPAEAYEWQLRERRRYSSVSQFIEWVTLLSAGFPLP